MLQVLQEELGGLAQLVLPVQLAQVDLLVPLAQQEVQDHEGTKVRLERMVPLELLVYLDLQAQRVQKGLKVQQDQLVLLVHQVPQEILAQVHQEDLVQLEIPAEQGQLESLVLVDQQEALV